MIIQSRASLKAILPHDWLISRLGLHGKFMSGSAFPDQFQGRCNEEIPFYKVADLARSSDGVHMPEPMHTISDETRKRLKAKLIPKGSIVYAKIGAASLLNRRRVTTRSCCIDNNMTAFVPEQVSPEWALIWLRSLDFGAYMCPATVPSISEGIQADLPLGLPPMEYEQRSIALLNERLPKIDKLITLLEDKSSALSSYRQSLITRAVTKGLDPNVEMKDSGYDIANNIPIHWVTIKLQYLCKLATGNQDTQDAVPDGQYPFYVRSPTIERTNHVTYSGTGILMAGDGVGAGKVFHYAEGQYGIHQRVYLLSEISDLIDPKYLFFYIKTIFSCEVERGTAKSTVPSIRMPMLTRFLVCVPPKREQIEIRDYCQKVEEKTEAISEDIKNNIHLLKEYRSSLISAAVTGQLAIEEAAE